MFAKQPDHGKGGTQIVSTQRSKNSRICCNCTLRFFKDPAATNKTTAAPWLQCLEYALLRICERIDWFYIEPTKGKEIRRQAACFLEAAFGWTV
jgi:hypothetical protein